jgi:tetratricopeptide (TPR) repeat protein
MSEKNKPEKNKGPDPTGENFDDLEDAFFASGDASSFWETADADQLDADSEELAPDVDPLNEVSEPFVDVDPVPTVDAVSDEPESTDYPVESKSAAQPPPTPKSSLLGDVGEFYNPSALHPAPDLIADDETEVWVDPDLEKESGAATNLVEAVDDEAVNESLELASAATVLNEPDAISKTEDDFTGPYVLPDSPEDGWNEAATALRRAAGVAEGESKAVLLSESARILLSRVGDWAAAGEGFSGAINAGLDPLATPKGYADVVASNGHFEVLRDLLVARAASMSGPAAVEAFQDAAIVERNHLKNDDAAVALLEQALEIREDWFTLRLLRELHYRSQSWEKLIAVLQAMAGLSDGARAARCRVEEGRIRETELGDSDGAAQAYQAALDSEPSFLDAFLAAARVNLGDGPALSVLYKAEAERSSGPTAGFWYGRAARTSRDAGQDPDATAELFRSAMQAADSASTSIHREAQAAFVAAERWDDWFDALASEAKLQEGTARAATLLQVGEAAGSEHTDRSIAQLIEAVASDPECSPAADLAVSLLIQAERPEQALTMLAERLEATEDSGAGASIAFRMGEICEHNQRDHVAAAAHYQDAADRDPEHPFASVSVARSLGMAKDWSSAASSLMALAEAESAPDRAARFWHQAAVIQRWHLEDAGAANASDVKAYTASSLQPAALDAVIDAAARSANAKAHVEALSAAATGLSCPSDRLDSAYRAARLYSDVLRDPGAARTLLHRCVEIDPHCQPVVSLLRGVSARLGDWQAVYDLRRVEASANSGEERIWHLTAAAHATAQIEGLDAQTVALEILDIDAQHPAALAVLERAAIQSSDRKRLIGVYRRIRNSVEDPARRTAIAVRLADLAYEVGDRQLAMRSITRVLEASVGPRPYGAMGRLAVGVENWALAEAALHADGDQLGFARLLESTSDDHKRVAATWRSITKAMPECGEAFGGLERALTRLASRDGLAETHAALARIEANESIANMHALLAGHLFENEDNPTRAVDLYGLAFESQPYRGKAFEALVRIHCENRDVPAVKRTYKAVDCGDDIALADALIDAGADEAAGAIYLRGLDASKGESDAAKVLPGVVRYEQTLIAAEAWPLLFELLGRRLSLSDDPIEVALVEAKRRWVLSERMTDSEAAWDFYRQLHEAQPEDSDVLENLARIAGARGERKLAIQFLDGLSKIATTAEDAARYQRRVAEVHLANEDTEEARSAYLRALDHEPEDLEALLGLKEIAEAAEDWQGLAGVLTRKLQLHQGESKVEIARAIAILWETKLGDAAVAVDAWRRVLELVPGDKVALQHLVSQAEGAADWTSFIHDGSALIHYLEGEERTALLARMGRVSLQELQREDEAVRFLDEASGGEWPNMQASEDLERIYAARGAWDQVVECVSRRASASEGDEAVALFLRAARTKKNQLRDRRGAADLYDEVLRIDENEPTALQFKGEYLFEQADLAGAVAVFERIDAIGLDRDLDDFDVQMEFALYCFHFGEALRRLSRNEDAIVRYEQALALNGNHLPTLEAVGPLYVSTERWSEASKVFRQVLQLTGGQGEPKRLARVYACLGVVEHAQGRHDKAVLRFDKALELQPNDIDALRGYAAVLYDKKDWNNLLISYNNIIHHASDREAFVEAYLMKGYVLDVHMTLADKAAQHYEKSLSFDAAHPGALMRLAELALRKDDWDRALSYAKRAISVGEDIDAATTAHLQLIISISLGRTGHIEGAAAALVEAEKHAEVKAAVAGQEGDPVELHAVLRSRLQTGL